MAQDAPIRSIFYARFHEKDGPKVLHQVPEGSVIPCLPSPTSMKEPLFDFQAISSYLIPIRDFCNRPLSICSNGYRILGHPVRVTNPDKYARNDFIFNFCIVVDEAAEHSAFARVVSKLAGVFGNLEEQNGFLSKDEEGDTVLVAGTEGYGGDNGSKVFAIVEMVFEDLNAVGEVMIPIDESNTLNLTLFPSRPQPPFILNHHVPLSTTRFSALQTSAWDLTVQRIIPHINGINSVSQISQLADVDPVLTRRAIQHLVYYSCVSLLDIFSFSAVYAPTPLIKAFISSSSLQAECRAYVFSPDSVFGPAATPPSAATLVDLYTALRPSLPLRDFCLAHAARLAGIDVRRLVTFGVLHRLLYRAHRYAVHRPGGAKAPVLEPPSATAELDPEAAYRLAALSSGWRLRGSLGGPGPGPVSGGGGRKDAGVNGEAEKAAPQRKVDREVLRYADGTHCLDEAGVALGMVEGDLVRRIRDAAGEGAVFLWK